MQNHHSKAERDYANSLVAQLWEEIDLRSDGPHWLGCRLQIISSPPMGFTVEVTSGSGKHMAGLNGGSKVRVLLEVLDQIRVLPL